MIRPLDTKDEPRRIDALRSLGVLDTPPSERFDRYTRIASRLFDVPIALVSLVDTDRQWFLSRVGLDIAETPRSVSLCGHAILGPGLMIVPDTALDPRFRQNPLVCGDPRIRFYVAAPLRCPMGFAIGTLCLIDNQPREFGEDDQQSLQDLTTLLEREFAAIEAVSVDALTGLTNRVGFVSLATRTLEHALATGDAVALIYADLDDFKDINDAHGHPVGDAALQEFADLMQCAVRESDLVARMGGDEFCLLVSIGQGEDAEAVVARLRTQLDARNRRRTAPFSLACSFGTILYNPTRHTSLEDLLREADAAMYADKSTTAVVESGVQSSQQ